MPATAGNVLEIDGKLIFPSLVLAGGFYFEPGVGIVPIPNGVYAPGQIALSAVLALKQYATVAASAEVKSALNSAAEDLAKKLSSRITEFQNVLSEKISKLT